MYEQFYGLREKPFALTPDPAYLYPARRHRHALTMLEYALSQASGFALITGEVGLSRPELTYEYDHDCVPNISYVGLPAMLASELRLTPAAAAP